MFFETPGDFFVSFKKQHFLQVSNEHCSGCGIEHAMCAWQILRKLSSKFATNVHTALSGILLS